jgi:hypothetical protein
MNIKLTVAAILLALWSATAYFFYAPTEPLSQAEIDNYMVDVQKMLEANFVMPEGVGLDPLGLEAALTDFREFAERDDGYPIYMVNLMKWRQGELSLPAGVEPAEPINTAADADLGYNAKLFWELLGNYSHTAYLASAEANAINYGTSAHADAWGEIGIFRYNSRRDFFNMITADSYSAMVYLKFVSMGEIAIAPSQPHGLLFNPMPNMPVLLFFLLTIGYLVFLVFSKRSNTAVRHIKEQ